MKTTERTYKYPVDKKVYYFYHKTHQIRSGTVYQHYTPIAGEVYLMIPDDITKSEQQRNDHIKKMRKEKFGDIWDEPVTHISDIIYQEHTRDRLGAFALKEVYVSKAYHPLIKGWYTLKDFKTYMTSLLSRKYSHLEYEEASINRLNNRITRRTYLI